MSRLPRIGARQLLAVLRGLGFTVIRIRGSHHFLRHSDGRVTTVPVHGNETIGPGLLAKILKDIGLTTDHLTKLL